MDIELAQSGTGKGRAVRKVAGRSRNGKPVRKYYEKAGFILEGEKMDAFLFKDEKWERCKMMKQL